MTCGDPMDPRRTSVEPQSVRDKAVTCKTLFFGRKKHVVTSVLLIAGFVPIRAEGTLLPVGDDRHLLGTHPDFRKIAPSCLGAFVAQNHVVVGGASVVTVPFDFQDSTWMILEIRGVVIERFHAGIREGPLIIPKENILQTRFHGSFFFFCQFGTLTYAKPRWVQCRRISAL